MQVETATLGQSKGLSTHGRRVHQKSRALEAKIEALRGTPMKVGDMEEIIDDDHAIVAPHAGLEYYTPILSIVDKDQLEPGCSVLLHDKLFSTVGIL